MNLLSDRAEQEIIDKVAEVVFKAFEVKIESNKRNERYLQSKQAAVYEDISVATLNRWVSKRRLPQAKIGGVVLYDTKDIDEFISKYKI